jgi:hypothetical protein
MVICSHSIASAASVLVLPPDHLRTAIHPAGSVGHSRLSMELATRSVGDTRLSMVVATCAWNFSPPRIVFLHGSLYTLLLIMETRQRCRRLTMREEPVIAA